MFWIMAIPLSVLYMSNNTMMVHIMPFALNAGISNEVAALFAMTLPLISIIGRLSGGWLSASYNPMRLILMSLGLQAMAYFLIFFNQQQWAIWTFLILVGPAYGCSMVLRSILVRLYFDRSIFGTVQGLLLGIMTIGSVIGPIYAGFIFDNEASYRTVWLIMALVSLIAIIFLQSSNKTTRLPRVAYAYSK